MAVRRGAAGARQARRAGWSRTSPGGDDGIPGLDGFADPGAQLRALQEQERLRPAGTTTVGGKRAHRLVSDEIAMGEDEVEIEFTVDVETYLPLSHRFTMHLEDGRTMGFLTRYRVYERLPLDAKTGRLLALDPHPTAAERGASVVGSGRQAEIRRSYGERLAAWAYETRI